VVLITGSNKKLICVCKGFNTLGFLSFLSVQLIYLPKIVDLSKFIVQG